MISFHHKGNLKKTTTYLNKARNLTENERRILNAYGERAVQALKAATPVDSGETAEAWSYEIHTSGEDIAIWFTNSNINEGVPIAVILQYGHGTRNGGYVQGRDYINPALRPLFDNISIEAWKEVGR